jgi:HEAT repeat protein
VETITYLGLLLERHARNRYDDPIYEKLYFPPGWLELRLDREQFDAIVDVLADVLERHPRLRSTAAFALGKARSEQAVRHLAGALQRYWQSDDQTTYQLLVALDNRGKERVADLIDRIAREGLPNSRDFARDIVRLRTS